MAVSAEDFERQVRDGLIPLLPASLQATAARYLDQDREDGLADADGTSWVKLDVPEQEAYALGGVDVRVRWPTIEIAVPDMILEGFDVGQRDADAEVSLVIAVWLKDARFPVLERMAKRYVAAIFDCLTDPHLLAGGIQRARFAWRTNPETPEGDDRFEACALCVLTLSASMLRA